MKKLLLTGLFIIVGIAGYFVWLSDRSAETVKEPVPVINVMDILKASDLRAGVKQAVKQGDDQAIEHWLQKGQEVGREAGLSQENIAYLGSEKAKRYVKYNAKRDLFNEAFEQRYANLQGIGDLKERYPEANKLYEKAQELIAKRDSLIEQIAGTLAEGGTVTKAHREAAQQIWQKRHKAAQQSPAADSDAKPE
ncbi:hypothetical protein IT774_09960 [Salinimonas marina]|uniref:Uncharacterized protein n=1 Tax=Salinimonas marina TaxID=2785918 RepID=A0A7S9DVK8_9ALTE|nr:hypothetical protein [Salinimonas marina]QPG04563.1 hypothetical protein IT774_09960 [Salinimonas marina]